MSKSPKMSLDASPYKRYFGGLIQKMGLRPIIRESTSTLYLDAQIPLPNQYDTWAAVRISLTLSDDQTCWIVSEFTVATANPFLVLSGSDLLEHYGKLPGWSKLSTQFFWTMTRAADLQALLKAYDELARELGKPILFGH